MSPINQPMSTNVHVQAQTKEDQFVSNMFDQIAGKYDLLNHLLSLNVDVIWRRYFLKRMKLENGDLVLDVCTGTGDLVFLALQRQSFADKMVGLDFSANMLQVARKKACARNVENKVSFIQGNALQMPFANQSFSKIISAFGVRNFSNTRQGIAEMYRVLKPGGMVGILEFGPLLERKIPALLFGFYFKKILPLIGNWIAPGNAAAYRYLPDSVSCFMPPQQFQTIMSAVGFEKVNCKSLLFGVVNLYFGYKPIKLSASLNA